MTKNQPDMRVSDEVPADERVEFADETGWGNGAASGLSGPALRVLVAAAALGALLVGGAIVWKLVSILSYAF